ncbi:MAG: sigma 54-interacting transcriptional regulator [Planctomycetes bacterium]|nr:sigma 54-interacting transcriptional regulator [Planctomycetota bacterium]
MKSVTNTIIENKPALPQGPVLVACADENGESALTRSLFRADWFQSFLLFLPKGSRPSRHEGKVPGGRITTQGLNVPADAGAIWDVVRASLKGARRAVIDAGSFPPPADSLLREIVLGQVRDEDRAFDCCTYRRYEELRFRFEESEETDYVREGLDPEVADRVHGAFSWDEPLLLVGETGTGKSRLARVIHKKSPRSKGPFVERNAASIPAALFESELFGHVRGAFTGAEKDRSGLLARANGGTFLLDEIGELSRSGQCKLLDVIRQDPHRVRFEPVGAEGGQETDVRVVAGTNRPVRESLASGKLRGDLLFRFSQVIELPPLRKRIASDPAVLDRFLEAFLLEFRLHYLPAADRELGFRPDRASCMRALGAYSWPGNVRQLYSVCFDLFRLAFLGGRTETHVSVEDVGAVLARWSALVPDAPGAAPPSFLPSAPEAPLDPERARVRAAELRAEAVRVAAEAGGFVPARGARIYDCHPQTFKNLMKRHGLGNRRPLDDS